jgi:hypothetical protein
VLALRTYPITVDDVKRVYAMAQEAFTARACPACRVDFCEACQADADRISKLADAISMAEAGLDLIFTTVTADKPKERMVN